LTCAARRSRIAWDVRRGIGRCQFGCMHYRYQENEVSYQRLQKTAESAVDYAGRSFENFDLRPFLEAVLPLMTFSGERPRAFEYGTGTGSGACFLAARGFVVDAVDISPTAIAMAHRFADERRLTVSFTVCDIRSMISPGPVYDLVVDNFCLQRIVTDGDRRRTLATVRGLLKPSGYFVVGTVPYRASRDFDRFDPSTGIVYRRVPADSGAYESAVHDGAERFVPWRRLVLSPELLRDELERGEFRVTHQDGACCLCVLADRPAGGLPSPADCGGTVLP
jgi:SAM-dependent methyltransferase